MLFGVNRNITATISATCSRLLLRFMDAFSGCVKWVKRITKKMRSVITDNTFLAQRRRKNTFAINNPFTSTHTAIATAVKSAMFLKESRDILGEIAKSIDENRYVAKTMLISRCRDMQKEIR